LSKGLRLLSASSRLFFVKENAADPETRKP